MISDNTIIEKMQQFTPQQSLDNLELPANNEFINFLKKLVANGNKIVGYQNSPVQLASYPPQHCYAIKIITPQQLVKNEYYSYTIAIPKTSNINQLIL